MEPQESRLWLIKETWRLGELRVCAGTAAAGRDSLL